MKKTGLLKKSALFLVGILPCIFLLEIVLRLGGFIYLGFQEQRNQIRFQEKDAYRILCLGESTTQLGGENSYPAQLEKILNKKELGIQFKVINKGLAGTTSPSIMLKLPDYLEKYQPDMVISMMGVNDGEVLFLDSKNLYQSKSSFFLELRVFKLFRLLQLHLAQRLKEIQEKEVFQETRNKEIVFELDQSELVHSFDPQNLIYLAEELEQVGEYERAEEAYREPFQKSHNPYDTLLEMGWFFKRRGKYPESEAAFQQAIQLNSKLPEAYLGLGWNYCHWWELEENHVMAEEAFEKALEVDPENPDIYVDMGTFYRELGRFEKMKELFQKALDRKPDLSSAYVGLGWTFKDQSQNEKAAQMFRKAIQVNPKDTVAYEELGRIEIMEKQFLQAETTFKAALERGVVNERIYGGLAISYASQNKDMLASQFYQKVNRDQKGSFNAATFHSYQKLKKILLQAGISLICVQYPLRSLEPLEQMFYPGDTVFFVDNEMIFKEAVREEAYEKYFEDIFAGDFGHCTPKGNALLASNIANVITQEVLGLSI